MPFEIPNIVCIEDAIWIAVARTGVGVYDFDFETYFATRHLYQATTDIRAIARMGAAEDYTQRVNDMRSLGVELIHTPEEYDRTSVLPVWYPILQDLTPRSVWFERLPTSAEVEAHFNWPVFVKGERQTNRHREDQAVIESAEQFNRVMDEWSKEPILAWQRVVCREFLRLRKVSDEATRKLPASFEFRTFCWRGKCVGIGRYWTRETYSLTEAERIEAVRLAEVAAGRIAVPFVVVDVAQTVERKWIVIEVNDGQDSGYAGVAPLPLWQRIVDREKGNVT